MNSHIIREYLKSPNGRTGVVRSLSYNKSLAHVTMLAAYATELGAAPEDVVVRVYGGTHFKRTVGVEFPVPDDADLFDWDEIQYLEDTIG